MSAEPDTDTDTGSAPTESLLTHLLELRRRLLISIVSILVVFVALLPFANTLFTELAQPLLRQLPPGQVLQAIDPLSKVLVPFRLAFFAALFAAMPVVLYQLWAFVAPGLYRSERRLAGPLLFAATALFYTGAAFVYFVMLPAIFGFLSSSGPEIVADAPDIAKYLDFVLVLLAGGGFAFEVPVAVVVAVILGWVTPQQLAEWRGYVIVVIFIIAAILTPPDGLTQVMLALPMWLLYELGLLWTRLLVRRKAAA